VNSTLSPNADEEGLLSCIFATTGVGKLVMSKPKNPPQNAVGTTNGVLKNQLGTLKGQFGTLGGAPSKTPKNAKK
jgi:hypothetical protein